MAGCKKMSIFIIYKNEDIEIRIDILANELSEPLGCTQRFCQWCYEALAKSNKNFHKACKQKYNSFMFRRKAAIKKSAKSNTNCKGENKFF
jgi:hypothetical protein